MSLGDDGQPPGEPGRPMPDTAGIDVLRYLMREHGVNQSQLPEIGAQSMVSSIRKAIRRGTEREIRI
ncbi:hypothetical protein Q668_09055 [Alcanivorax sp. PN-3]|nr:hypothetical protein Q668_09055 [Alcanivorax sp. PN-3]